MHRKTEWRPPLSMISIAITSTAATVSEFHPASASWSTAMSIEKAQKEQRDGIHSGYAYVVALFVPTLAIDRPRTAIERPNRHMGKKHG